MRKQREATRVAHRSDGVESRRLPIRECRSRVEDRPAAALGVEAEHRRCVDGEPLPADADALHVHVVVGRALLVGDDGRILHGAGAFPRSEAAAAAGLVVRADRRIRSRSSILPGAGVSSAGRGGVAAAAEGDGARGGGRSGEGHQAVGKGVGDRVLELRVEGQRALAEPHEPPGA